MARVLFVGEDSAAADELAAPFEELQVAQKPVDGEYDVVVVDEMGAPADALERVSNAAACARSLLVIRTTGDAWSAKAAHDVLGASGFPLARSFGVPAVADTRLVFDHVYHCGVRRPDGEADALLDVFAAGRLELRNPLPYRVQPIERTAGAATSAEHVGVLLPAATDDHEDNPATVLGGSGAVPFQARVEGAEVAMYKFRDCIVCGHSLAIVAERRLDVLGSYMNRPHRLDAPYFLDDARRLLVGSDRWTSVRGGERWLLAANRGWDSYFHWIVDCLPSAWFALRHFRGGEVRLVVPPLPSFATETLAWLGIGVDALHVLEDVPQRFEELYFPSSLHEAIHAFNPGMGDVLREIVALEGERPSPAGARLYVSRRGEQRRTLRNEEELEDALRGLGFRVLSPGEHTVAEQRQLFAEAALVVGPHGGGLTNVVFMHPGTQLLELHYPGYLNDCFYRLAQVMDVRYATFFGDGEPGKGRGRHTYTWWVDVPAVVKAVERLLR